MLGADGGVLKFVEISAILLQESSGFGLQGPHVVFLSDIALAFFSRLDFANVQVAFEVFDEQSAKPGEYAS
jgi:hypothetical protein